MKSSDFLPWNLWPVLKRHAGSRHAGTAALVAVGTAAAILFFVIGVGIRLLIGPVSLGPFAGSLAGALADALPGITVKYDQAAIAWEREEGRVTLVILGTRVFDAGGRIIAQAPKADIDLAAAPLLQGKVVVRNIALVGVQLTLVRTKDGGLRLGVEKDTQERDILKRIADAIAKAKGGPTSLKSFAIRHARLAFYDETTGLFIVAPKADLKLATEGEDLNAKLNADVEISGRPAHVAAEFVFPPGQHKVRGAISLTGLEIGALVANSKTFAALKDAALKIDLTASFATEGPRLVSADFGAGASGEYSLPGVRGGPVHVRKFSALGRYDAKSGRLLFDDADIDSDKIKAHLRGWADLVIDASGTLTRVNADLRVKNLLLDLPGVFVHPVEFPFADLSGAWVPEGKELVVSRLAVVGGPFSLQASGKLTLAPNASAGIEFKGATGPLSVRDLVRYWPLIVAKGARDWVDANMPAGRTGPLVFDIRIPVGGIDAPALAAEALNVQFTVEGAEVNYITGLTHVTQVRGTAKLTGTSFNADIASAKIGPLNISSGRFVIPDLNANAQVGEIAVRMQGTMPDVLALTDMKPLGYPSRFGIVPTDTKGTAALDLQFRVPLLKNLSVNDVGISVRAVTAGFSVALGPRLRVTDGAIDFTIDNTKLHAAGTAGIGGSPSRVTLDWIEDFDGAKAITSRIAMKGLLDDTARKGLGLHTADYLKGPVGVSGTLTGHRGLMKQGNFAIDFTPAVVALDAIDFNKPAGFAMNARLTLGFGAHDTLADLTIRLGGSGINATANVKFGDDGKLILLQAPTVHIGQQNDFSLNLTQNASGLDILLRGRAFDGSRLTKSGVADSSGGNGNDGAGGEGLFDQPFHLNAKLDRLSLRSGVAISAFGLDVTGVQGRIATMSLTGSLSKTATVGGSMVQTDTGRNLAFSAGDATLLIKGLYGVGGLRGGKLDIAASFPGKASDAPPKDQNTPDFKGKLTLKDFRVLDQPFLARLFAAGSLGGLINLMQGEGIAVDSFDVPFSSRGNVVSIHEARATGPAIGLSADGYIDRPKNVIALKGTLVPLFTLNSVLGNIPLLGSVLTSKQGEGIIGMSYSVTGNADEPSISVNPLSVLTPGIFRRIFEGKMPTAPRAPSDAPKTPVKKGE